MFIFRKILLILFTILSFSIYSKEQKEITDNHLNVFTSVLPQKFFVEKIGGDRVSCNVLVGPGQNPATYQPIPSQIMKLSKADVLFTIGVPFEKAYLNKVIETLHNLKIIDSSYGITKRTIEDHHEEGAEAEEEDEHHNGELDPHVWLSPVLAKIIAKNIYDTFVLMDPEGSSYYLERYNTLLNELDIVTVDLHQMLKPLKGKILFVYHPSFGYFADEFGLRQIAIETGGKEPTTSMLMDIINEANQEGVKMVIVQPEFSKKSALIIANSIKGTVTTLNPLDPDYINNLKEIAKQITKSYE